MSIFLNLRKSRNSIIIQRFIESHIPNIQSSACSFYPSSSENTFWFAHISEHKRASKFLPSFTFFAFTFSQYRREASLYTNNVIFFFLNNGFLTLSIIGNINLRLFLPPNAESKNSRLLFLVLLVHLIVGTWFSFNFIDLKFAHLFLRFSINIFISLCTLKNIFGYLIVVNIVFLYRVMIFFSYFLIFLIHIIIDFVIVFIYFL